LQALKEAFRVSKPLGARGIMHLKKPGVVNSIHQHMGGAIVSDRLPEVQDILCKMEQAGFTLSSIESYEQSAVMSHNN
jgi:hypothetical protein